jgi:N-methylhydantoinase A
VDVRSVGAGGGSIAWLDPVSKALRVGPESAGADPGPAAYGRGGTEPTVTDANVVLGYIDPDNFLGGEMKLDKDRATTAIAKLAEPLGLEPIEFAARIVHIVEAQMAELIRQMTVQSGYDPRDFIVFAYGGAGPTHGVGYASELGAKSVVVPLLDLGAVWSAYGVASSDLVELVERTDIMRQPFDLERLNGSLAEAERSARRRLVDQGIDAGEVEMIRHAHLRYSAQINEVAVPIEAHSVDEGEMQRLIDSFEVRYEQLYGKGSGYAGAGYAWRLRAMPATTTDAPSRSSMSSTRSRSPSRCRLTASWSAARCACASTTARRWSSRPNRWRRCSCRAVATSRARSRRAASKAIGTRPSRSPTRGAPRSPRRSSTTSPASASATRWAGGSSS